MLNANIYGCSNTTRVTLSGKVSVSKADLAASVGLSVTTSKVETAGIHSKITNKKKKWARLVVVADVATYNILYVKRSIIG